jgi:hypothetical protein
MAFRRENLLSQLGFEPWNIQPIVRQTDDVLFRKSDSLCSNNNSNEYDSSDKDLGGGIL